MPFMPAAVRAFLLAQPSFAALIPPERIVTRDLPETISAPCFRVRNATNNAGVSAGSDPLLRFVIVQLEAWVPKWDILGGTTDPEEVANDIAMLAGELVGRARNVSFRGAAWSGRWLDSPTLPVDVRRGVDNPLYPAMARAELTVRTPRT